MHERRRNGPTNRYYWFLRRQFFFVRQRLFYVLSFLLLDNQISGRLRASLLRFNGAKVGRGCFVRGGLMIQEDFQLTLGDNVFINAGCCFDMTAPVTIQDEVRVSYQVTFVTGAHRVGPHERRAGEFAAKPIVVEAGAWIGARAVILAGVTIGAGAVVAAGSVVTRDVPPDTVVAGVPAKVLRTLGPDAEEEEPS